MDRCAQIRTGSEQSTRNLLREPEQDHAFYHSIPEHRTEYILNSWGKTVQQTWNTRNLNGRNVKKNTILSITNYSITDIYLLLCW